MKNTRKTDHHEEHEDIIRVLKNLPSVHAPVGFEERLKRRIEERRQPWWKDLLRKYPIFGHDLPVLAYALGVIVVTIIVGIYLYRISTLQPQIPDTATDKQKQQETLKGNVKQVGDSVSNKEKKNADSTDADGRKRNADKPKDGGSEKKRKDGM